MLITIPADALDVGSQVMHVFAPDHRPARVDYISKGQGRVSFDLVAIDGPVGRCDVESDSLVVVEVDSADSALVHALGETNPVVVLEKRVIQAAYDRLDGDQADEGLRRALDVLDAHAVVALVRTAVRLTLVEAANLQGAPPSA